MRKLEVYFSLDSHQRKKIGVLADSNREIFFEYDPAFLEQPLWLSPFKLPPTAGLHRHQDRAFGPLFGLFDDSLPDGWGLMLMDRAFRKRGTPPETLSPLDRLAYMGSRTMGALTYFPASEPEIPENPGYDLNQLAEEAYRVLQGKATDLLPQLLIDGGSPGGARPKVLIGLKDDEIISGSTDLPEGFAHWIVKFHSSKDEIEEGRIEYAYSKMAAAAGLDMPETRLFSTSSGKEYFGIERFDRNKNQRIHLHSFGNLIHSNFRIPSCDYQQLLKITRVLTKNQQDVAAAFRLMVFNVLAHNRDDHVKNVAFMFTPQHEWRIAPAYDLTYSHGPGGEQSMTIAGEGKTPTLEHMLEVAKNGGLTEKEAGKIHQEVSAGIAAWPVFANEAGLSKECTKQIQQSLSC